MPDLSKQELPSAKREGFNTKYWIGTFLVFVVFFVLVVYYFAEIKKEFILLEKIKTYWLALALAGQFLTYYFTALIYRLLVRTNTIQQVPKLWELIKASIISLFFNQTIPSAGISGNTYFFRFLSKFNLSVQQVLGLILTELLLFYAAMEIVLVGLLVSCLLLPEIPTVFHVTLGVGVVVYLLFGIAVGFAGRNNKLNRLFKKLARKKGFEEELNPASIQLLAFIRQHKQTVLKVAGFQLLVIASDAFTLYSLFEGLGITIGELKLVLSLVATKVVSILPFLPGGLVLYESSMTYFFVVLGIPVGSAVVVTLVYRLLSFWVPIPLGFLLYRRWLKQSA